MTLVLSLFPGIGLLDMAFELEGFCVVRGPDPLWGGDVRTFHPPAGCFDGVIGGPPCQMFSKLANLVRAQGHQPRFGNLIPEFERCVLEAAPTWFLMEEVPDAPVPIVPRYSVHTQDLNNRWLGAEQHRLRTFSFGYRDALRPLRIETLALEAALRHETIITDRAIPRSARQYAGPAATVTSNVGGKGKGGNGKALRERAGPPGTVTSSDGGASKKMWRYSLKEALELQGLPADFLDDAPFTAAGKLSAVANGVPLYMGRALARAVREALARACAPLSTALG